jgi:hypothetical protein
MDPMLSRFTDRRLSLENGVEPDCNGFCQRAGVSFRPEDFAANNETSDRPSNTGGENAGIAVLDTIPP